MAGKKDILWVADRTVAQLQSSLTAKLSSLQTEYNDGLTLTDIPDGNMFVSERKRLPPPPFICVIPDRTDAVPFTGEARYDIEYHYLTAAVVDVGNLDPDRLKRRCARYVRAVEEVLIDQRTFNGSVDDIMVLSKEYAPMMSAETMLMQEGQVSFRVQTML